MDFFGREAEHRRGGDTDHVQVEVELSTMVNFESFGEHPAFSGGDMPDLVGDSEFTREVGKFKLVRRNDCGQPVCPGADLILEVSKGADGRYFHSLPFFFYKGKESDGHVSKGFGVLDETIGLHDGQGLSAFEDFCPGKEAVTFSGIEEIDL